MEKNALKYHDLCIEIKERCKADGVVLFVIGGSQGSAFVLEADAVAQALLPDFLEQAASQIRRQRQQRGH